jgi:23S rRNA (cytosine1962-C5)-methyltransferase
VTERLPRLVLKKGKEKPLLRGHPWTFSGAVERWEGEALPGDVGEVYGWDGLFLGRGHLNPRSQIVFRLLTRAEEPIDEDLFRRRLTDALRWRESWYEGKAEAYRIVNGEGDFLPGLILDRYGEALVLQCLTAGMDRVKGTLVDLVLELCRPRSLYERSDSPLRGEEGLKPAAGLLYGEPCEGGVPFREEGLQFRAQIERGQKTGFYLDQRENRLLVRALARGRQVLDCFCYTGGFSLHAAAGGASRITLVDASREALGQAEAHLGSNGFDRTPPRTVLRGDAFTVLRTLSPGYDLIILDPPPFSRRKGHIEAAARGYKDLNLQAFRLLGAGGLLFTFSCSHHVSADLFQKIVFGAAADAGREVQILRKTGHPADHPVSLYHPEGEYLKGLLLRAL